jgi:hypothetical protein
MSYRTDPGGVFDSDTHRRVLGHLPLPSDNPISAYDDTETSPRLRRRSSLFHRMEPDQATDIADEDELTEILSDLEADGYASQSKDGWKQTKKGLDALNAPVPSQED